MINDLPGYVVIIFLLTVALSFILFVNAAKNKITVAIFLFLWLAITGILSYKQVFQKTDTLPPRLMIVMAPAILIVILLLVTKKGLRFTVGLELGKLTLFHIVRLPVEITLYLLYSYHLLPGLMTFEGRNFDILSGISAPIIYFICFKNAQLRNRGLLLLWNFLCLGLLLNIVIIAILSAPFPFQQFGFDQPNIAVLYFPFTWLPCFIVVLVLYSHLAAIKKLLQPGL